MIFIRRRCDNSRRAFTRQIRLLNDSRMRDITLIVLKINKISGLQLIGWHILVILRFQKVELLGGSHTSRKIIRNGLLHKTRAIRPLRIAPTRHIRCAQKRNRFIDRLLGSLRVRRMRFSRRLTGWACRSCALTTVRNTAIHTSQATSGTSRYSSMIRTTSPVCCFNMRDADTAKNDNYRPKNLHRTGHYNGPLRRKTTLKTWGHFWGHFLAVCNGGLR